MKTLTIVMAGRNDNYGGYYTHRLEVCLSQLADALEPYIGYVQVIYSDWGSEKPIRTAVNLPLVAEKIVSFLTIPLEMAQRYTGKAAVPCMAYNAVIRRLKTDFCMHLNSDVFVPKGSMQALMEFLNSGQADNKFFWCSRYDIPFRFIQLRPDKESILKHIAEHGHAYRKLKVAGPVVGCANGLLMQTSMFQGVRAFNEAHTGWGWSDTEFHWRLLMRWPAWGDLDDYGFKTYHQDHHKDSRPQNAQNHPTEPVLNGPDWGLGLEIDLKFIPYDHTEFDPVNNAGLKVEPISDSIVRRRQARCTYCGKKCVVNVQNANERCPERFWGPGANFW